MNPDGEKLRSRRGRLAVAVALAFVLVAGLAYLLTRAGAGQLPPMPRASFSTEEVRAATDGLARRTAGHLVSDAERNLERLLAGLGQVEAGREPDPDRGEQVALAMKAFSEAAQTGAAADPQRYL
ncbi:MAG TPA: hypothetical protein VM285_10120, partial [Polyangia bacterium]|nr:hypothetical protein [Polyangia bacterium]